MSFNNGPRTVTTGLSLLVDAADPLSYPGSGTSWTDIVTGVTGSLSGSITYSSDFKGALVVNNSSSVIIFPTASGNFGSDSFTVELAFQPNQINGQHWLVAKNSGSFPSWGAFITGSGGSGRLTAFFNISSTVSCSMSTPTGSIVTGSNYLVDINFAPSLGNISTIYLNSELSASITPNGTGSLTTTSSLFISNRNSGSSVGIPSEIFNAKLYTPRLVPGAIRQNYNSLSTRLSLPQKSFLPILPDGLLNFYPGAAAAYSLRVLNSDYAGSAIRVRRSSDNAEQDIGFLNGVLDTNNLLTFIGAGDGFVTTWYDQSGNSRNLTQTTAANQPQIVSSGNVLTLTGNGSARPILRFDGTNDSLTGNSFQTTNIYSWFSVLKLSKTSDGVLFQNGTTNGFGFDVSNGGNFSPYGRNVGNTNIEPNNTNYNLLTTIRLSTSSLNFWRNSINRYNSTTVAFNQPITGTFYLGVLDIGVLYYGGDLTEIIFYITDQTSNQINIESNINSYYQIY